MKKMNRIITETNMEKMAAFLMARSQDSVKLSKTSSDKKFKIKNYVFYTSEIVDVETGVTDKKDCLLLDTTIGKIGTASNGSISTMHDLINELGFDVVKELDFNIISGENDRGTFYNINVVINEEK